MSAKGQEDGPALPARTDSLGTKPQRRHHQGCARRHLQDVQEEGMLPFLIPALRALQPQGGCPRSPMCGLIFFHFPANPSLSLHSRLTLRPVR